MRRSKRIAVQVHLCLGLVVGLLWSLQGLTGAALVFHRELDRWAHPEWRGSNGPTQTIDQLVASAERRAGYPVTAIGILDSRRDLRTALFADRSKTQRMLLLNAATGTVVGERDLQPRAPSSGSTSRFIYMIHQRLSSGHAGETIIGVSGCLLLSSAILGMWLAWPRRGNLRALVTPRGWRTQSQKLSSWHRTAGLGFGIILVAVATGGIAMTFNEPIRRGLIGTVGLETAHSGAKPSRASSWRPAQEALDTAESLFPGAKFVRLALPTREKPYFVVRLRQRGEVRAWSGATNVTLDGSTGNVLQVEDGLNGPFAERVLDAQFSIHNGEAGGFPGRVLVMMAGLALPSFYVTGVLLWLRKRSAQAKKAQKPIRRET